MHEEAVARQRVASVVSVAENADRVEPVRVARAELLGVRGNSRDRDGRAVRIVDLSSSVPSRGRHGLRRVPAA